MRVNTKWFWFVSTLAVIFLCSCTAATIADPRVSGSTLPADTQAKIREDAVKIMQAEEETFRLFNVTMDEYQDTLAMCDQLTDQEQTSSIRVICKEKLKTLREEMERLSSLLQRQP